MPDEKTKIGRKKNIICPLCKKRLYGLQNLKVHLTYKHPEANINEILSKAQDAKKLRPYKNEKEKIQEKEQPKKTEQPTPEPAKQEPGIYDSEPVKEYPDEETDDDEPY